MERTHRAARKRRLTATRIAVAAGALSLAALVAPPAASGAVRTIDLRDGAAARITGAPIARTAGDVNGDGFPDLILGRYTTQEDGIDTTYVLFGDANLPETLDVSEIAEQGLGFEIKSPNESADGSLTAGGCDVDGDGLADVLVGDIDASNNMRGSSGTVYVVFGKPDTDTVDLMLFDLVLQGDAGFRVDGPGTRAYVGSQLACVGDINGDGLDEVVTAAPFYGSFYVVFGKSDNAPVDLLAFEEDRQGESGFRIVARSPEYNVDYSVSGAGEVNGDGVFDVVLGVIPTRSAYVIYGKRDDTTPVDTRDLKPRQGFRIKGPPGTTHVVAGLGDVNRDGRDDVALGVGGEHGVYVVFGKAYRDPVRLGDLGRQGYRIGTPRGIGVGYDLSAVGDVNRDGKADALIGAPEASFNGREGSGSMYVVFGKESSATIRLGRLGHHGYRIDGPSSSFGTGAWMAGPGDINRDDVADIAVGAPGFGWRRDGKLHPRGAVYLVWGRR